MAECPLKLEFNGTLLKHTADNVKGNVVKHLAVKCPDGSEINTIVADLVKWAGYCALGSLEKMVPANSDDIPWSKLPIPLTDYDLYFDMSYGNDMVTGENGTQLKVRLMSINFTRKVNKNGESRIECVFNFDKLPLDIDNNFDCCYLKYKEEDPSTGKRTLKLFNITLSLCEPFLIGDKPEESLDA